MYYLVLEMVLIGRRINDVCIAGTAFMGRTCQEIFKTNERSGHDSESYSFCSSLDEDSFAPRFDCNTDQCCYIRNVSYNM